LGSCNQGALSSHCIWRAASKVTGALVGGSHDIANNDSPEGSTGVGLPKC